MNKRRETSNGEGNCDSVWASEGISFLFNKQESPIPATTPDVKPAYRAILLDPNHYIFFATQFAHGDYLEFSLIFI